MRQFEQFGQTNSDQNFKILTAVKNTIVIEANDVVLLNC